MVCAKKIQLVLFNALKFNMNLQKNNFVIPAIASFVIVLLFGCESNFKEVQKINFSEFMPNGDANDVNLKYTDSGRITAVLLSKKMLDYSDVEFPFTEFPKGIHLTLYDKNAKKKFIKSNYAVSHKGTSVIDLQGKVTITSQDGQVLETEQLYFDQKTEWFFTERKFKFSSPKGISNGQGIDFSKDFKIINSQRISGEVESDN
jgi:LPS export ABC transporter protein LptC